MTNKTTRNSKKVIVSVKKENESDVIWNNIKNIDLELYSLNNQLLQKHVTRFKIAENEVHLKLKSTGVLPALESMVSRIVLDDKQMHVEETDSFIIISLSERVDKGSNKIGVTVRALEPME